MAAEPTPDVEVTPAMIEAALEEYKGRWLALRRADDAAARAMLSAAYREMDRVRRQSPA